MFRKTISIFALILMACASEAPASNVIISNLKSGLACPFTAQSDGKLERGGFICVETEEIFITGQSKCNFDGEIYPCTWYGFEFEYTNNTNTPQKLNCVVESDIAWTYGNPKSRAEDSVKKHEYEIEIQTGSGRFYNPQYSLFGAKSIYKSQTVCSAGDTKLFELQRQFINP